jgi:hypothetical protein
MSVINHPSADILGMPSANLSRTESEADQMFSFKGFVFRSKINCRFLWIALVGSVIQLTIFKLCFPFPDFISDSYDYIESAAMHYDVNLWPIGYAKFIYLIHQITYSDTFLVVVQYALLQISLLYFFFSVNFLYRPSQLSVHILYIFLIFNPVFPYLSNCVLSDALFSCITVVWFTLLLWQLRFPSRVNLTIQVILIGIAFMIRYTAIYYPFVSCVALLLTRINRLEKIAWMMAPALLIAPFIRFTQLQTQAVTGASQFSVFGGWQTANNALYMYGHIQVDSAKLPQEMRPLDRMVKQYYKWAPPGYFNFNDFAGTFFIKHSDAPLKQYLRRYVANDPHARSLAAWGKVSPLYQDYGTYLIRHYPLAFARYYLLFNARNYFAPYLGQFEVYNVGDDEVWDIGQYWFHYPTSRVWSISKTAQGVVFFSYPPAFLLLNIFYSSCLLWLLITRKFRRLSPAFQQGIWLLTGYLLLNFGFSVLATPIVLRYQVVPLLLLFTFSLFLLEFTEFKKAKNG